MASYFTTRSNAEFDALLDKTTSDLLPSGSQPSLTSSLHLADLIRSSSIPPHLATKSFIRRLSHENPNVQILLLHVLDIAIKNGGTPFLLVISGKELTSELERLGRARSGGESRQVQELVLKLLQDWATAFGAKAGLRDSELVRAYESMRRDGLAFPPRDPLATAAMVDSLSAPEWSDSAYCTRCRSAFTMTNRKHHCRHCGSVFDAACSSQTAPLPHYGILEPVRVCDGCKKSLKEGKTTLARRASLSSVAGSGSGSRDTYRSEAGVERRATVGGNRHSARSKEEEDLQRAIDASLADVAPASSTNGPAFELRTVPSTRMTSAKVAQPSSSLGGEEDPDLAAAIAASLRDIAIAPSAPQEYEPRQQQQEYSNRYPSAAAASSYQPYPSASLPAAAASSSYAALPSYDLTPSETTSLSRFTTLLSSPPPMLGSREREIYEAARRAHPRLERGLEDTERRKELLLEMEGKLGEVVRLYEGLLKEKERSLEYPTTTYSQPAAGSYYAPTYPSSPYAAPAPPPAPSSHQQHQHQSYYASTPYPQQYAEPQSYYSSPPPPSTSSSQQASYPQYSEPQSYHQEASSQLPYSTNDTAGAPASNLDYYGSDPHAAAYPAQPYEIPSTNQQQQYQAQQQVPVHQQQQQQQQQQHQRYPAQPQQPSGFYKPSSFPVAPTTALPSDFPNVPVENPWEREAVKQEEQAKVGELIEL